MKKTRLSFCGTVASSIDIPVTHLSPRSWTLLYSELCRQRFISPTCIPSRAIEAVVFVDDDVESFSLAPDNVEGFLEAHSSHDTFVGPFPFSEQLTQLNDAFAGISFSILPGQSSLGFAGGSFQTHEALKKIVENNYEAFRDLLAIVQSIVGHNVAIKFNVGGQETLISATGLEEEEPA